MYLLSLNRLGDWNPQLFRELKGRIGLRNLALAVSVSLLGQLLVFFYWVQQDWARLAEFQKYYYRGALERASEPIEFLIRRCKFHDEYCLRDTAGNFIFNWDRWWQQLGVDIFQNCSFILALVLVIGGVYMLASDLAQEERRGTLNFLRLSPESSQSILTGKILGVPVLLYLGIALAVPLHLWSAKEAGVSPGLVLSFYALSAAGGCLFFCAALLYTLLGGFQAWLPSGAAGWLLLQCLPPVIEFCLKLEIEEDYWSNLLDMGVEEWPWFYVSLGMPLALPYSFTLLSTGLVTWGIWQILNRRFRNPSATVLSKRQSYIAVACLQIWLLGLTLPSLNSHLTEDRTLAAFTWLFTCTPVLFLALIAALSPHRQALQDWARYSSGGTGSPQPVLKRKAALWNRSLVRDLIWGEKSPAIVAVAINLALTVAIWLPWILLAPQNIFYKSLRDEKMNAFLALLLTSNFILICALLVALMLVMKTQKRSLWAAGAVAAATALPLAILSWLSVPPETNPIPWLFTAIPSFGVFQARSSAIFITALAQWSVMGVLSVLLAQKLRKMGESASKSGFVT